MSVLHLRFCILGIATLAATSGCAAKQKIAIGCVPEEVAIYVDGERLDELPDELDLRSDRPHTLFFKGEGYAPELVVLNSEEIDGKARLSPGEVCVKPRYLNVRRELEMAIEPDVAAEPPGARESRAAPSTWSRGLTSPPKAPELPAFGRR